MCDCMYMCMYLNASMYESVYMSTQLSHFSILLCIVFTIFGNISSVDIIYLNSNCATIII